MNYAPSSSARPIWSPPRLLILFLILLSAAPAPATISPYVLVTDFGMNTASVRRVTYTPIAEAGDYEGAFLAPRPISPATFTNGHAQFTNMAEGYAYTLTIETTFKPVKKTNFFATGMSGVVDAYTNSGWIQGFASDGSIISFAYDNIGPLLSSVKTNGVNLAVPVTSINFVNGANTTVTGAVSGASVTIGISSTGGGSGSPGGSDTQVQFNDSSAFGGDSGLLYNKTDNILTSEKFRGDARFATNAPRIIFTNIAELVASPLTNGPVNVLGYYGTNSIGGGEFRHATATATTNLGTIFASAYGGYWHRLRPSSNVYHLEWFGVTPMNSDDPTTRRDSYRELTNAFAVAGDNSTLIFPAFGVFTATDIITTNWFGRTLRGSGVFGAKNVYPQNSSWLAYQGAGGANSVVLRLWNARECEINGIGFETSTPVFSGSGYYVTNNAEVALDLDQFTGGGQIATANAILNCSFRSRGTNVTWSGLRISATSAANAEHFRMDNLYFHAGGNVDLTSTGNVGTGILIGSSANARAHDIRNVEFLSVQIPVVVSNGGFALENGLSTAASYDFKLNSWAAQASIKHWFSEANRQCFWINTGAAGGGGATYPVLIEGYHSSHSASEDGRALFELHGAANVVLRNSAFYNATFTSQKVFTNDPGFAARMVSQNNQYGISYSPDDTRLGVTNFAYWKSVNDDMAKPDFEYRVNNWEFNILDPVGKTNRELFRVNGNALQLSRTNSRVQIGNVPAGIAAANLAIAASSSQVAVDLGDSTIVSRFKFQTDGTDNGTTLVLNSTNSAPAQMQLKDATSGGEVRIIADDTGNELRYANAPFSLRHGIASGGTITLTAATDTSFKFTPTNAVGFGFVVQHPSSQFTGAVKVASFTNSGVTSAIIKGDSAGRQVAAVGTDIVGAFTGTPDGSKFLRDDGTLQSIPGGGDMLAANNLSDVADAGASRTNLVAHNGDNITAGTVADARIASTIARDSEVATATNDLAGALGAIYQAKDTDLDSVSDGITGIVLGAGNGAGYSAAAFANVQSLAPGPILTNGHTASVTYSNPATTFRTNVFVGGGLSVSNIAASSIVGTTAARAQTNITIGSGLTFDGVTLAATGGGGEAIEATLVLGSNADGQNLTNIATLGATNLNVENLSAEVFGTDSFHPTNITTGQIGFGGANSQLVGDADLTFATTGNALRVAGSVATPIVYTDAIETTNASGLTITAAGDTLTLASDTATYNGSGGFVGVGTSLTALNGENISNDTIDDDSIDFGTGTDQVSALDIPIADTPGIFAATEVEAALQEARHSTNVIGSPGVLAPTGNQTNYTVPLVLGSGNDTLHIYLANTNAFITFTGTNVAFANRSLILNGLTNTTTANGNAVRVSFVSAVKTNFNFNAWITNGQFKLLNFFTPDTAGTNVLASDAGFYRGGFTQ